MYSRYHIDEVLSKTDHRPWALPKKGWRFYQEWNDAIFLHWRVDGDALRKLVPASLQIDGYDRQAWVSIVAFDMHRIRPRYVSAFPPISNFHEINIRTYVSHRDRPGVYFLSIEGGKRISCAIAEALSGLPYRYAKMNRQDRAFVVENTRTGTRMDIRYTTGQAITDPGPLDRWLTERYALFLDTARGIESFETHHVPWPLFELKLESMDIDIQPQFKGLLPSVPDVCHYSPGVQVLAW